MNLRTLARNQDFMPLKVEGDIPFDLGGTLYRVGVFRYENFGVPYRHWFDGDGGIAAIRFASGKAVGAARALEVTPEREKRERRTILGRFGQAPESLWMRLQTIWTHRSYANAANTSMLSWQGRLFALYEGGFPTEVDPETLEALGETSLGIMRRSFSAHPKYNARRRSFFGFGFRGLPRECLDVYALPDAGAPSHVAAPRYSGAAFVHDFFVSENFVVFGVPPLFANRVDMLWRGVAIAECMEWKPERGMEWIVVPLDRPSEHQVVKTPARILVHTANAHEDGERLILDGIFHDDATNMEWVRSLYPPGRPIRFPSPGLPWRAELDRRQGSIRWRKLGDGIMDFPQISPHVAGRPYRFVYGASFRTKSYAALYDCACKLDVISGESRPIDFGPRQTVSEATFVSRRDPRAEDDGYLLYLNHDEDSDRSYAAVVDAATLELRCKLWFDQMIPYTNHGLWLSR